VFGMKDVARLYLELLRMGKKLSETCWTDWNINKLLLLHLVGLLHYLHQWCRSNIKYQIYSVVIRILSSLTIWPLRMGPICRLETWITTNQWCVTFQKSEDVNSCTHWMGRWVGPRVVLDVSKERNMSCHCPNSDPELFSP